MYYTILHRKVNVDVFYVALVVHYMDDGLRMWRFCEYYDTWSIARILARTVLDMNEQQSNRLQITRPHPVT